MKIKNLEKAAARIRQAVDHQEQIILYGDSDLDGIASTIILEEAIKNIGGKAELVLFPNRELDGYGINKKVIALIKEKAFKKPLFISLDLGIGNIKEVEELNSIGCKTIVIDHHQILNTVPKAEVVVDPQQEDDESEYRYLCNGGLTFKLAEELLGENLSLSVKKSFLELAALATISDMVPQIGENKIFLEEGLRSLKNTFRPGLRAFIDILGTGHVVADGHYKIISALNSAESDDFKNLSYQLLSSHSPKEATDIAQDLLGKASFKQLRIKQITEEVERRISQNPDQPIIFEGDPSWKTVLAGPTASNIFVKYNKPTFIFKRGDQESTGSVRSPKGLNSVEAMKSCADLLVTFGGHPQASGFRVKNENLEKFKEQLIKYFSK